MLSRKKNPVSDRNFLEHPEIEDLQNFFWRTKQIIVAPTIESVLTNISKLLANTPQH